MAKPFNVLLDKMSPKDRAWIRERAAHELTMINLQELRQRKGVNQSAVAEALDVTQGRISQLEKNEDMLLSSLSAYVAALGGRLEINACFPDETVPLRPGQYDSERPAPSSR